MDLRERNLAKLRTQIAAFRRTERATSNRGKRAVFWTARWALMLYHEFIRDNVKMRAESMAYLMLLSLLPLLAGGFFIFSILAQFGFVQDALVGLTDGFLKTIPTEHRGFIHDYILKFKDAYLEGLQKKSGSLGIFALLILAWVGLQTFINMDQTLNSIWSSSSERSFLDKTRNFIVVVVVAPIVLIGALSVPLILRGIPTTAYLLERVPALNLLLNFAIPLGLVFFTFLAMYRYLPVRLVQWKAAVSGALFATVFLELTNGLVRIYFQFGTQTAYGKLAIVPLIAFWLMVIWIVVILGAEVSYLAQNQHELLEPLEQKPSLASGRGLLALLVLIQQRFTSAKEPVELDSLPELIPAASADIDSAFDFLVREKYVLVVGKTESTSKIVPARELEHIQLEFLLSQYFELSEKSDGFWETTLRKWIRGFNGKTIGDLELSKL